MGILGRDVVIGNVRSKAKSKKRTTSHSVSKTCQIRDGKEGDEKHWKVCGARATHRVKYEYHPAMSACSRHAAMAKTWGSWQVGPLW